MIFSKVKLKRIYSKTKRIRFIATSLLAGIVIYLWTSELPISRALACLPAVQVGFFCSAVTTVTTQAPFNGDNGTAIQVVFLAINLAIAARVLWKGYQAWSAREAGEEYQSTVNGIIMGLATLYVIEYIAKRLVGAP